MREHIQPESDRARTAAGPARAQVSRATVDSTVRPAFCILRCIRTTVIKNPRSIAT